MNTQSLRPILALEISTECCSVALMYQGDFLEQTFVSTKGHSEALLPMVRALLRQAQVSLSELQLIAYGAGPGAFTGLRLACGAAQGLAMGSGLPVLGVSTLEALAWQAQQPNVYAALDARMNELYFAAYRVDESGVHELLAPGVASAQEVLLPDGDGWFGCGTGFGVYGEILQARFAGRLVSSDGAAMPNAKAVAQLAALRVVQGEMGADPFTAQPAYVRQKVALTTAERLAAGGKA